MKLSEMTNGLHVITSREIDIYPVMNVERGMTGVVCNVDHDGTSDVVAMVRLDTRVPDLDEWDNCIHLYRDPEIAFCTAGDFEAIPDQPPPASQARFARLPLPEWLVSLAEIIERYEAFDAPENDEMLSNLRALRNWVAKQVRS